MKIVIVGLGIQGRKRRLIANKEVVATVDPHVGEADYKTIEQVPLNIFEAACICVPDQEKLPIIRYLISNKKHVLVEKPLLAEIHEIEDLIHLAKTNHATCYTAYNHRFEPHIVRLKQILKTRQLGAIYLAKFFYGNGTARDVRNSPWRDKGLGVLADLGSHLLDLALFLFGSLKTPSQLWTINRFENLAPDHVSFGFRSKPLLEMEATLLSWRNSFGLDVYGELGSAHIDCLCKWGPSILIERRRILPSGRPEEKVETLEHADPTWKIEHEYFTQLCHEGRSNLENDLWISEKIRQLTFNA